MASIALLATACGGASETDATARTSAPASTTSSSTSTLSPSSTSTATTSTTSAPSTSTTPSTSTSTASTTSAAVTTSAPAADPDLSIDVAGTATYDTGTIEFLVGSDSPAAITKSVDGDCDLQGDTIRLSGAGQCVLEARQDATDDFDSATVTKPLTIEPGIRSFETPAGITWSDLPQQIKVRPDWAPLPSFTEVDPASLVCGVEANGTLIRPSEFDGRQGTCKIEVTATGTPDWTAVNQVLDIEIGGPAVVIVLAPGQQTTYQYTSGLEVEVDLEIVENSGGAGIGVELETGSVCTTLRTERTDATQMRVTIGFLSAGSCELSFTLLGSGIFDFSLELPAPIVLTASEEV